MQITMARKRESRMWLPEKPSTSRAKTPPVVLRMTEPVAPRPVSPTSSEDEIENLGCGIISEKFKRRKLEAAQATKDAESRLAALRALNPLSVFNPQETDMD